MYPLGRGGYGPKQIYKGDGSGLRQVRILHVKFVSRIVLLSNPQADKKR
jgi:hypothetical protein